MPRLPRFRFRFSLGQLMLLVTVVAVLAGQVTFLVRHLSRQSYPLHIAMSADGTRLAAAFVGGEVRVWETARSNRLLAVLRAGSRQTTSGAVDEGPVVALQFVDRDTLLTVRQSGAVDRWDLRTKSKAASFLASRFAHGAVVISGDGEYVAFASTEGSADLWDASAGRIRGRLHAPPGGQARSLAFSPDGRLLAMGSWDQHIVLLEIERGAIRQVEVPLRCGRLVFSPDDSLLAVADPEFRSIGLMEVETCEPKHTLRSDGWMDSVQFAPDGKTLVAVVRPFYRGSREVHAYEVDSGRAGDKRGIGIGGSYFGMASGKGKVAFSDETQIVICDPNTLEVKSTLWSKWRSLVTTVLVGAGVLISLLIGALVTFVNRRVNARLREADDMARAVAER